MSVFLKYLEYQAELQKIQYVVNAEIEELDCMKNNNCIFDAVQRAGDKPECHAELFVTEIQGEKVGIGDAYIVIKINEQDEVIAILSYREDPTADIMSAIRKYEKQCEDIISQIKNYIPEAEQPEAGRESADEDRYDARKVGDFK